MPLVRLQLPARREARNVLLAVLPSGLQRPRVSVHRLRGIGRGAVMIDHTEAARAWAKVLAYKRCGDEVKARQWWERLCELLGYEVPR